MYGMTKNHYKAMSAYVEKYNPVSRAEFVERCWRSRTWEVFLAEPRFCEYDQRLNKFIKGHPLEIEMTKAYNRYKNYFADYTEFRDWVTTHKMFDQFEAGLVGFKRYKNEVGFIMKIERDPNYKVGL